MSKITIEIEYTGKKIIEINKNNFNLNEFQKKYKFTKDLKDFKEISKTSKSIKNIKILSVES